MLDIHWTLEIHIPQLDAIASALMHIGDSIVASVDSIKQELVRLTEAQAAGDQAIAQQLTVIADEIAQFNAQNITQEQLDRLEAELRGAADKATQQAQAIKDSSAQIATIVPDTP